MSYFAAVLARTDDGWAGEELDLDDVGDLDALADVLRDLVGDGPGPALLLLEENDEHLAVVRVDSGAGVSEPRVFLSDRRAVQGSEVAAMLWEEAPVETEDDEDEGTRPIAEPVGDTGLLADLGTPAEVLVELCAEEGLLPADVLTSLCERAGCDDVLEQLREA